MKTVQQWGESYTGTEVDTEKNTKTIPDTTEFLQNNTAYNLMGDAPDPDIITPSDPPLNRKNEHWGNPYKPDQACEGPEFIRKYRQMSME